MIKTINYLFVTCFGIGSFRFVPGTIASLVTTVFLYSLFHIVNLSNCSILIILLIVFIFRKEEEGGKTPLLESLFVFCTLAFGDF